jgi:copper resistance protein D
MTPTGWTAISVSPSSERVIALLAVIRWFHEISLMLLFGGAALLTLLRLTLPWNGFRISAACVALLGGILWFILTAAEMGGALSIEVLRLALTQTLFGILFQARMVLLILLLPALARRWPEIWVAAFSGAALVLISVTSHAAQSSPAGLTAFGAVSDGLHFLTGGFWIGGLAVLAALYARHHADFPRALAMFAEWGMVAVAVLILTGMVNAPMVLLGGAGHDSPLYLSVLGAKLVLVAAMVRLALINHFKLLPGLAKGTGGALNHNIRVEFTAGLVVIALAVLLSVLQPTLG